MEARVEILLLAAAARGAAPAHVLERRLTAPADSYAALAALERRRLVHRTRGVYRVTGRGRRSLHAERELAKLIARSA